MKSFARVLFLLVGSAAPLAAQDHFTSDRPDFVRAPHTVGKGVFQIELSGTSAWKSEAGNTARGLTTPTLLRFGLSEAVELRVESEGYVRESAEGIDAESGMADAAIGLKWHAVRGEEGGANFAFIADAKLPTGSELFGGEGVRPGLRAIGEWELSEGLALGVMPGIVYNTDAAGDREWSGLFGAALAHEWNERSRTSLEYAAEEWALTDDQETISFLGIAHAIRVGHGGQLDVSFNLGLSEAAPDGKFAIGYTRRFD